VQTAEGARPIEEIEEGDSVLSWNEQSGQVEYQRVTQTFVRRAEGLVVVTIEGEEGAPLVTTAEHPFYIHRARDSLGGDENDKGEWVGAGELRAGDHVRRPSGEWVRALKTEARAEGATVYNFEVADSRTYLVGLRAAPGAGRARSGRRAGRSEGVVVVLG
jgi:Pretoxin HINT domain